MMGGLSLNASGAALDSSFGVFEVAHGACCDAGRQVEAQQGAGRSADAGARDRVGVVAALGGLDDDDDSDDEFYMPRPEDDESDESDDEELFRDAEGEWRRARAKHRRA